MKKNNINNDIKTEPTNDIDFIKAERINIDESCPFDKIGNKVVSKIDSNWFIIESKKPLVL